MAEEDYDGSIYNGSLVELGISQARAYPADPKYTINVDTGDCGLTSLASFNPVSKRWELCEEAQLLRRSHLHVDAFSMPTWSGAEINGSIGQTEQSLRKRTWTDDLVLTDHVEYLKAQDWASTTLGPIDDWPLSLRLATHQMLADPRIACVYWGSERVAIYNHAYSQQIGRESLCLRHKDVFPKHHDVMSPKFDACQETGIALHNAEIEMFIERNGYFEEVWFNGAFIPLRDETGKVNGFYNSIVEITRQKLADRRCKALNALAITPDFQIKSVWHHILDSLYEIVRDVPMAALYSAKDEANSCRFSLNLEGCLGIKKGHRAAPQTLELHERAQECFLPGIRQAMAEKKACTLDISHGELSEFLSENVNWRGFKERSRTFIVNPLVVADEVVGFLIMGLNPRREYDEDYKQFIHEVGRLSSAAVAGSIGFDKAKAREAELAKRLTDREGFVRTLAQIAPVGIYNINQDGVLDWANDKYWEITGLSSKPEDRLQFSFLDCVATEDRQKAIEAWDQSRSNKLSMELELRLKRKWTPPSAIVRPIEAENRWILVSFVPFLDDDGEVKSVMGSVTDVTHIKWAEHVQADAAENAKEARRLQEKFIDMTSHEMRNPLSAILQCADSITTTLSMTSLAAEKSDELINAYDDILDSAETISLCASHQKRIIDDILTVSKLDSSVLAISPVLMQPAVTAQQAIQMFEPECKQSDIKITFVKDQSIEDLGSWAYCDPSRLTQILVNLLTNAIKFTKTVPKREICLTFVSSCIKPLTHVVGDSKWFGTGLQRDDVPRQADWGQEPDVYLTFAVTDTGPGITAEEMTRLFNRFAQANAKTHVQYGGSGLGLYISRELAELQGGMIGASSTPGSGSTFAFYIKAPMASPAAIHAIVGDAKASSKCRTLNRTISQPGCGDPAQMSRCKRSTQHPRPTQEILLVEDNLVNQKVLAKQLRQLGHTVHIANHGEEALDFVSRSRFWTANKGKGLNLSVILMDLEMPVCDGLTATRRIRDLEKDGSITHHLHVIATTANARAEQIHTAFAAGIDDLLAKPFKVHDLMNKIYDDDRHGSVLALENMH